MEASIMKNIGKSKIIRLILALTLLISSCTASVQPALASGTETWYAGTNVAVGVMRLVDETWTPVKTIGNSGTLQINVTFSPCRWDGCDDYEDFYSPIRVTCDVYTTSGEYLGSGYGDETTLPIIDSFNVYLNRQVYAGETIRLHFDVSTQPGNTPPGSYRKAHIGYAYTLN